MSNSLEALKDESYILYLACNFAPKINRNALASLQLIDLAMKDIVFSKYDLTLQRIRIQWWLDEISNVSSNKSISNILALKYLENLNISGISISQIKNLLYSYMDYTYIKTNKKFEDIAIKKTKIISKIFKVSDIDMINLLEIAITISSYPAHSDYDKNILSLLSDFRGQKKKHVHIKYNQIAMFLEAIPAKLRVLKKIRNNNHLIRLYLIYSGVTCKF